MKALVMSLTALVMSLTVTIVVIGLFLGCGGDTVVNATVDSPEHISCELELLALEVNLLDLVQRLGSARYQVRCYQGWLGEYNEYRNSNNCNKHCTPPASPYCFPLPSWIIDTL